MTAHHEIKVGGRAPFDDARDPENNAPATPLRVEPEPESAIPPPPPPLDRAAFVAAGYPDDDAVYAEYLATGSVPPKPEEVPVESVRPTPPQDDPVLTGTDPVANGDPLGGV